MGTSTRSAPTEGLHQPSFSKPETRLGFPPPLGETHHLALIEGRMRAVTMILSAVMLSRRASWPIPEGRRRQPR